MSITQARTSCNTSHASHTEQVPNVINSDNIDLIFSRKRSTSAIVLKFNALHRDVFVYTVHVANREPETAVELESNKKALHCSNLTGFLRVPATQGIRGFGY